MAWVALWPAFAHYGDDSLSFTIIFQLWLVATVFRKLAVETHQSASASAAAWEKAQRFTGWTLGRLWAVVKPHSSRHACL